MRPNRLAGRAWTAALLLPLATVGCGGGEEPGAGGAGAPLEAALVPGADFLLRVDVEALRGAPIYEALRSEPEEKAPEAAAPDDSDETPAPAAQDSFDYAHFAEATGLGAEDFVSVLASADADAVDPEAGAAPSNTEKLVAAAAVRLAKPLSLDTLERALKESAKGETPPAISRIDVSGTPALMLDSQKEDEPDVLLAAAGGDLTYYLAPNQASLAGALERAAGGQAAAVGAGIEQVSATLPAGAQVRLTFLLPEAMRTKLQEEEEEGGNPMGAMLAPFRKLRSLALSVEAGEELGVVLAGDLAEAAGASQAAGLLGGMVAPMAHSAMAEITGATPQEMADRLTVTSDGAMLRIRLRVTASDAIADKREAAKKAAEAAAAP